MTAWNDVCCRPEVRSGHVTFKVYIDYRYASFSITSCIPDGPVKRDDI